MKEDQLDDAEMNAQLAKVNIPKTDCVDPLFLLCYVLRGSRGRGALMSLQFLWWGRGRWGSAVCCYCAAVSVVCVCVCVCLASCFVVFMFVVCAHR